MNQKNESLSFTVAISAILVGALVYGVFIVGTPTPTTIQAIVVAEVNAVQPAWCNGIWSPPKAPACAGTGAACDDGDPCTTMDRCDTYGTCAGIRDPYCRPCRTRADCCGSGIRPICFGATNGLALPDTPETIRCNAGRCTTVPKQFIGECAIRPTSGTSN